MAQAARELSAATGLVFLDDGPTDEVPDSQRPPYQPDLYGKRWAPLLVAWSDPTTSSDLEGDTAGTGGPLPRADRWGTEVYVSGQVTLDTPALAELVSAGHSDLASAVVVHEFGHALGLAHHDDPAALMHPSEGPTTLGDGDRRGLAALGRGPCVPGL